MQVIVTGAAGFVGDNNVKTPNDRGLSDVLAVTVWPERERLALHSSSR
jgi:nucleoside-diphosphate-sugar epimerase